MGQMTADGGGRRRPLRLPGYDYAQAGAYFVTLVTRDRECLFGEIVDGVMRRNVIGEATADEWVRSAAVRKEIELDAWVVMPNHLHGVVLIDRIGTTDASEGDRRTEGDRRSPLRGRSRPGPAAGSLGALVAGFKAAATRRINEIRKTRGAPVWQRNYYEHVIRSDEEMDRVRRYIEENPLRWELDRENPEVAAATRRMGSVGAAPGRGDRPVAPTDRRPVTGRGSKGPA